MRHHSLVPNSRWGMIPRPIVGLIFSLFLCCGFVSQTLKAAESIENADELETDWSEYDAFLEEDVVSYETDVHGVEVNPTDESTSAAETIHVEEEIQGLSSVSEVLDNQVGIQVRSVGGPGSYSTAQIRGSNASQVDVYLDGILLNSGGVSVVNLGDLSLDTLATIEIYRGSTPVVLGLGSIGGAIALNTRDGQASDRTQTSEWSASYGSWNTWRGAVLQSSVLKNVRMMNVLSVQGTDGDFLYLNRNGTPLNENDDEIIPRQNNDHQMVSHMIRWTVPVGRMQLSLLNNLFVKQQGVAGIESVPTHSASLHSIQEFVALQGDLKHDTGSFIRWSMGGIFKRDEFEDPDNEIGVGHQSMMSKGRAATGHVVGRLNRAHRFRWDTRLEGRFDTYRIHNRISDESNLPGKRFRAGLGTDFAWFPISELQLVPSGRIVLEHSSSRIPESMGVNAHTKEDDDIYFLPSLGTKWALSKRYTFLANVGRYVRTPNLSEQYGDSGTNVGNTDLLAEEGLNADMGMKYTFEGDFPISTAQLYSGVFGCWSDNLIAYVQNSQNTVRAENVDKARALGLETSLNIRFLRWFALSGNYTYLETVNRSDKPYHAGRQLPGRPKHEVYMEAEFEKTFGRFFGGAWFNLGIAGQTYLDQANLRENVSGRTLLGAGAAVAYEPMQMTLTFEVKNLLNTIVLTDKGVDKPLQDYDAFPLPGRSVFVTLHWKV
ncbi:MAG: TonB-dependent receptor [Deltaproteobacteria bacterium]|nr:TonB-dependent receptor [Deltaproteobacteria bacterium]MBN2674515.1 TonB-dependent receptor [Deltaproteobacteria bacterium]